MLSNPSVPPPATANQPRFSPLMLSDRLLTLAKQADHAGYEDAARRLLTLAQRMLSRPRPAALKAPKKPAPPASARPARYRPRAAAPPAGH